MGTAKRWISIVLAQGLSAGTVKNYIEFRRRQEAAES